MFKLDVLTKDWEAAYDDFLDRCNYSSVQHSLDWRNVICDLGKDEAYFVVAKENDKIVGALPLYYYRCKLGNVLTTTSWYTISGIICSKNVYLKEIYKALLDYSLSLAKELDCTAISISTNPFFDDKELYLEYFKPDYTMENFIQYTDVNEIFDKGGNLVHPNYTRMTTLSRNLKKAQRQQITISEEQTQNNIDGCFAIHKKRMRELGATPIPKRLYDSVLKNLVPKGKGKFLFAFYQGEMIAGCLFLPSKRVIDAYMMSMDSRNSRLGATYLLAHSMLKWTYENGFSILNWMSSPQRGDGVYKWKERWGTHERTFLYLTRILGNVSQWKNMGYNELKKAYEFHYLLPFNLLNNPDSKFTTKDELTSFMQNLHREINK